MVILGKDSGVESFPADAIYEEGDLVDGERNGLWTRFHANGALQSEIRMLPANPSETTDCTTPTATSMRKAAGNTA